MNAPNHGILGIKQGRHSMLRMTFANATDRINNVPVTTPARFEYPFTDDDTGSVAQDLDTGALFILAGISPIVWSALSINPDPTAIDIAAVKATPGVIPGGSVVRLVGYSILEGVCKVELAKADSPSTMPAMGISLSGVTGLSENTAGLIRVVGLLQGLDTSSFSEGDLLYVSDTVGGQLKNTRPQLASEVQPIAKVCRVDGVSGSMMLTGISRKNSLPNLQEGKIWIGDANGLPVETIDVSTQDLITGVLSGYKITPNGGDSTLFDIAAGTGLVISWIGGTKTVTLVSSGPFEGESVPDISTALAEIYIDDTGAVVKDSVNNEGPTERRTLIRLQKVISVDLTNITSISKNQNIAFQGLQAVLDYIAILGPINEGNRAIPFGTDLRIAKTVGRTTLPFNNAATDPQDPSSAIDPAIAEINPVIYSYRDGSGGFVIDVSRTALDPAVIDDGSGTLAVIPNNRYSNTRFMHFVDGNIVAVIAPQHHYATQAGAVSAIDTEVNVFNPDIELGTNTTIIVLEKSTTDLTVTADALFINRGFRDKLNGT